MPRVTLKSTEVFFALLTDNLLFFFGMPLVLIITIMGYGGALIL